MSALSTHRTSLGLLGLSVLALGVRLHAGRESFWLDEMTALEIAEKSVPHILQSLSVTQHAPALDYLILHLVGRLTDWAPAYWIPSLLWGLLAVPIGWLAIRVWFGETVAWWTAFLLCLAFLPVRYSLEARMYSLWLLGTLGSLWALGVWRSNPSTKRLVVWGVWALLVLHTHSFGLLIVGFQAAGMVLWSARGCRPRVCRDEPAASTAVRPRAGSLPVVLLTLLAVTVIYLPQCLVLVGRAEAESQVGSPFRWGDLSSDLFWGELLEPLGLKLAFVGFLVPVAALGGLVRLARQSPALSSLAFSWLVLPSLAILAVLDWKETFLAPRYFIFACPVYLLLVASGVEGLIKPSIPTGWRPFARALTGAVLLALVWPRLGPPQGDVWLPLVRPILTDPTTRAVLVADNGRNAPYPQIETSFYFRNHPARDHLGALPQDPALLDEILNQHPGVWLIETEDCCVHPEIREILNARFALHHKSGGHALHRAPVWAGAEAGSGPLEDPHRQAEAAPIPASVRFGEDLTLLSYGVDPPTVKPGDWVTLSLLWECRRTPSFTGCIAARMDRTENGALESRLSLDHFPWGGLRRFTEWVSGDRILDRWTVRVPEDFSPGPTELAVKLERPARLGSHLPDLPFYEVETLSDSAGMPCVFQGIGVEVSAAGSSEEIREGQGEPQVHAEIRFQEGGNWVGARVAEDRSVLLVWEGTARRPPARHFEVSMGEPTSGQIVQLKLPYTELGRPPATLAPGERVAYTLPAKVPETFLGKKWVLILGTLDPRTGEKVESQFLSIPAEVTGMYSVRRESGTEPHGGSGDP